MGKLEPICPALGLMDDTIPTVPSDSCRQSACSLSKDTWKELDPLPCPLISGSSELSETLEGSSIRG